MNKNKVVYIKYIFIFAIIIFIIYKTYTPVFNISLPFIASLIFAYLLSPIVNIFIKKKISKIKSIIITYTIIAVILILIMSFIFPVFYDNVVEITNKMPSIIEKYQLITNELIIRYEISDIPDSVKHAINQNISWLEETFNNIILDFINVLSWTISNLFFIILIPFITFYLLKDADYLKEKVIMVIPRTYRDDAIKTWYSIDVVLKRFIRGELLVALIVGILTTIGLYIIGVRFALVLGFIAGITNIIPYVGPFLGAIPSILVALIDSPILAIKAILVYFIIQQFEAGVVSPKIVGDSVGLNPVTIIFVILLFEQLFGLIGMFFAVPVTSILLVIFNSIMGKIMNNKNQYKP